jgi:predicted 2-oxoglutarate/Fe(II)-dependent dioxygenase YbiX
MDTNNYTGGSLTFYGLFDGKGKNIGFPLIGQAGLLVAFRSVILHGVTSVTSGERFTVVSWFV